jgi:hypothetical protein
MNHGHWATPCRDAEGRVRPKIFTMKPKPAGDFILKHFLRKNSSTSEGIQKSPSHAPY